MILDKEPYISSGEGTTDVTGVTWKKNGNVVMVSCFMVSGTAGGTQYVTGLPTPKGGAYVLAPLIADGAVTGFIQYNANVWIVHHYSTNVASGTVCYLTDE